MNFIQAIGSGFTNYVNFSGRAARSEYWLWVLFTVIGCIAAGILDAALFGYDAPGGSPLNAVFDVITFLPSLAIGVRRLHDIDRTGWWLLIALTVIGVFVLIYWACVKGTIWPNRFGPDRLAQLSLRPAV
jgi:uncharacterized membrane protein YhaH (DUF805 family)